MSIEAVDIHVKDRGPLGAGLTGVVVKILSLDGTQVFGQAETDSAGVASLLLPAPATYQVRFFKYAVSFRMPLLIEVAEGSPAAFNVYGEPYIHGQSSDARLCVASGLFRKPSGDPDSGLDMHFIPKFDSILLEGSGVIGERIHTRTDSLGLASVKLIRFGQYDVTIEGLENITREVSVPDSPYVNLPDLLFPVVKGITFDVSTPITMAVGAELEIFPHVYTTDLRELEQLGSDVSWSQSHPNVLSFEVRQKSILLRALNPGSSELRAQRIGGQLSIIRIPDPGLTGVPITVSVV